MRNTPKVRLIVYAKNVCSLSVNTNHKIVQLLAELENIEWDVILLSEVRTPTQKSTLDGGHVLYTSLRANMFSGTGILLHAKHVRNRNVVHNISDRVLGLDFIVNNIKVRAVAVYIPHMGYPQEDYDVVVEQIKCVLGEKRKNEGGLFWEAILILSLVWERGGKHYMSCKIVSLQPWQMKMTILGRNNGRFAVLLVQHEKLTLYLYHLHFVMCMQKLILILILVLITVLYVHQCPLGNLFHAYFPKRAEERVGGQS